MMYAIWLLLTFVGLVHEPAHPQAVDRFNVPEEVEACFKQYNLYRTYEVSRRLNPFYLRGDFDGDGKPDYAVLINEVSSRKEGIAICQTRAPFAHILAAGKKFTWRDSLSFGAWVVYGKRNVRRVEYETGAPPKLQGEAILIEWPEKGSGIIYWDGKGYSWYQQGI